MNAYERHQFRGLPGWTSVPSNSIIPAVRCIVQSTSGGRDVGVIGRYGEADHKSVFSPSFCS